MLSLKRAKLEALTLWPIFRATNQERNVFRNKKNKVRPAPVPNLFGPGWFGKNAFVSVWPQTFVSQQKICFFWQQWCDAKVPPLTYWEAVSQSVRTLKFSSKLVGNYFSPFNSCFWSEKKIIYFHWHLLFEAELIEILVLQLGLACFQWK